MVTLVKAVWISYSYGVELTPASWHYIYAARESYRKARGDDPFHPSAVDTVKGIYQVLNKPVPPVYTFQSPLAAMLAIPHLSAMLRCSPGKVIDIVREPLTVALGANYDNGRWRNFANDLLTPLEMPIQRQMSSEFLDSFTDQLGSILRKERGDDFFKERLAAGLFLPIHSSALDWWDIICFSHLWCWLYPSFAVVSSAPTEYILDAEGLLMNNDAGPAVTFADGYKIWAINGIFVTEQVILRPKTLSIDQIMGAPNEEERRIMIERFGVGDYLSKTGAKILDIDSLTLTGSAPRMLLEDKFKNKWLIGTDGSTARVYSMSVPRTAKNCRQAHSLISGFDEGRLIAEA